MINGTPYRISSELKDEIERKRKNYILKTGIKINQPAFTKLLVPIISNAKIVFMPFRFKNAKKTKKK